jgi:hypothetical protein
MPRELDTAQSADGLPLSRGAMLASNTSGGEEKQWRGARRRLQGDLQ